MELPAIRMACPCEESGDGQSRCQESSTCAVLFETRSLTGLGTLVVEWLAAHPTYAPLSLSHAAETRLEPAASLAGPRAVPLYSGILLVRLNNGGASEPLSPPDLAWHDLPPDERDELLELLDDRSAR